MARKKLSTAAGGVGINVADHTGKFVKTNGTATPDVVGFASNAQVITGTDTDQPVNSAGVDAAISNALNALNTASLKTSTSAPTAADNASVNDDDGNPLRVGSFWNHTKVVPPVDADSNDFYQLDGFTSGGDAIWVPVANIATSAFTSALADIATLQTNETSLTNSLAVVQGEFPHHPPSRRWQRASELSN